MTFDSLDTVYYTCIFLLPGYLIKSIRDVLIPARRHNDTKYFFTCLSYSIINCAICSWAYKLVPPASEIGSSGYWIRMLGITILGAVFVSLLSSIVIQKNWITSILNTLHINNIDVTPTAWDFFFSQQKSAWVIITLKNGNRFFGKYDENSFAASDSEFQDIYIEKTYALDENENWREVNRSKGVLISRGDIESIEFFT